MRRSAAREPTRSELAQRATTSYSSGRAIIGGRHQRDAGNEETDDDATEDSLDEAERQELLAVIKTRTARQLKELDELDRRRGERPSAASQLKVGNSRDGLETSDDIDMDMNRDSSAAAGQSKAAISETAVEPPLADVSTASKANATSTLTVKSTTSKTSLKSTSKRKPKALKSPLEAMKDAEFRKNYPTPSSYASYLALPSPTERHTIARNRNATLAGVRAFFLSSEKYLSKAIAINMENLVRMGGQVQSTFISPFDADGNVDSDKMFQATTHVIAFPPPGTAPDHLKFKDVLRHMQPILGKKAPESAVVGAAASIGEDASLARERPVWVVRPLWLSECCKLAEESAPGQARKRSEYGYLIACEGDKKLSKMNMLKRKRSSGILDADEDDNATSDLSRKKSVVVAEETVNNFHFAGETEESTQEQHRRAEAHAQPVQAGMDLESQDSHVLSAHLPMFESPFSFEDMAVEIDMARNGLDEYLDDDDDIPESQKGANQEEVDKSMQADDTVLLPSIRAAPVESDDCDSADEDKYRAEKRAKDVEITKAARAAKKAAGSKYRCDTSNAAAPLGQTSASATIRYNEDVACKLDALASWYEKSKEHNAWWRVKGYRTAAGALRNVGRPIETYEDAIALHGIGQKTAVKLVEIVRTGRCTKLESKTPKERIVEGLFTNIYGVGPSIAGEWHNAGMRTLEDVNNSGKFGIILTEGQKLGVKHFHDLQERIPRAEVAKVFAIIKETAMAIDTSLQIECMGSYRRGQPDCGDIDCLVTRDTGDGRDHSGLIQRLVEALLAQGTITYTLSNPNDWRSLDAKWMGLCRGSTGKMRRIDILGVPFDEMGAALIYFTGNDIFNRSLRLKARHMGYSLNQRGLFADVIRDRKTGVKYTQGTRIASRTEEEIFKVLGTTWRPPTERLP